MVYTICIGSNEHRQENMALARRRLAEMFAGIRFAREEDTVPLACHRPDMFSNQVARFVSDSLPCEVNERLKAIEREAGRRSGDKLRDIVRLDIDLLMCDSEVFKPEDLRRAYIVRGLEELK